MQDQRRIEDGDDTFKNQGVLVPDDFDVVILQNWPRARVLANGKCKTRNEQEAKSFLK
jgi:hypothetical protein